LGLLVFHRDGGGNFLITQALNSRELVSVLGNARTLFLQWKPQDIEVRVV